MNNGRTVEKSKLDMSSDASSGWGRILTKDVNKISESESTARIELLLGDQEKCKLAASHA